MFRREPPHGRVHRGAFWLFVAYLIFWSAGSLPGAAGEPFRILRRLTLPPLLLFSLILFFRWVFGSFLWSVRNRLIATYVLMGLAPLVLFATLAALAAYVFSGQFATFVTISGFQTELVQLGAADRDFALHAAQALAANPKMTPIHLPGYKQQADAIEDGPPQLAAFEQGRKLELAQGTEGGGAMETLPSWVTASLASAARAPNGVEAVVVDQSRLYLRAFESAAAGGHTVTVIASLPVEKNTLDRVAANLGDINVFQFEEHASGADTRTNNTSNQEKLGTISGGTLPPPTGFFDLPVSFGTPLKAVDWQTGKRPSTPIVVHVVSRPRLIYDRLFTTSLSGGNLAREVLIGIAIFFSLLELIAFFMAVRLNRTITESIHDLYRATTEIDKGDLLHRIEVRRRDQLGALSESFNRMAGSLARSLAEQREKQRMQDELAIAQEVQESLFPPADVSMPGLEVHGACRPASTVGGDYYDFLVLGETAFFMAMGDISGKGISAALLMATLQSAIRAYRFAGEEQEHTRLPAAVRSGQRGNGLHLLEEEKPGLFASPGKLLELLNQQLYQSTQPDKYATLFLACFETAGSRLTYSNGGHLPPIVLRADGTLRRLDCGGTVVGLIDSVRYEQDSIKLEAGDLLIAYSDGVTEPENEFGEFGEQRLIDIVRRNHHLPLAAISAQVLHSVRTWIGQQNQPDDITLVLARQR